jgi:carboxypeptidase C (cathepsin A)
MKRILAVAVAVVVGFVSTLTAQAQRGRNAQPDQPAAEPTRGAASATTAPVATNVDETPVVSHHQITLNGKPLSYTATVAQMPIKDSNGETEAHMFYVAYSLDGAEAAKRPVTFAFNGGPGSASVWVHMGGRRLRWWVMRIRGWIRRIWCLLMRWERGTAGPRRWMWRGG